uniref:Uncharacterized protein n=1 Tax=Lepeophtheirus salmonis TaxID=72036 RepID=A0A0K2UEZ4_LEPSM
MSRWAEQFNDIQQHLEFELLNEESVLSVEEHGDKLAGDTPIRQVAELID